LRRNAYFFLAAGFFAAGLAAAFLAGAALLRGGLLACNGGLQAGAGGELRHCLGGDFQRRAGLRVLAGARGAIHGLESAETDQGNRVAFRDHCGDYFGHRIDGLVYGGLRQLGALRYCVNQFALVHSVPLLFWKNALFH
jgi:hypothetical protein